MILEEQMWYQDSKQTDAKTTIEKIDHWGGILNLEPADSFTGLCGKLLINVMICRV